jgi:hypothetical protein
MTKEEILDNVYDKSFDSLDGYSQTTALKAMEQYAKEMSIGYNSWISGYENNLQAKRFFNVKTDDELYTLYLKHLEQENK